MKPVAFVLCLALILAALNVGCGTSTGKNLYKDKDKPQSAAPAENEK